MEIRLENSAAVAFVLQFCIFFKREKEAQVQPGTWSGLAVGGRVIFVCVFSRITGSEAEASYSFRVVWLFNKDSFPLSPNL